MSGSPPTDAERTGALIAAVAYDDEPTADLLVRFVLPHMPEGARWAFITRARQQYRRQRALECGAPSSLLPLPREAPDRTADREIDDLTRLICEAVGSAVEAEADAARFTEFAARVRA